MSNRQRAFTGWSDRDLRTGARWRAVLLAAVIVLAQSGTALAQRWYEEYDDGLNAIEAQGWVLAVERLEAALEKRADQSRDPIRWYGTIYRSYIPQFYLAVAYFNLSRSEEAVDLLENVQRDGLVVAGDDEFPQFTTVLEGARRRVALTRADGLLDQADTLIADNQFDQARRQLNAARDLGMSRDRLAPYRARIATGERLVTERAELAEATARFNALMRQATADLAAGRLAAARRGATEARRFGVRAGEVTSLLNRVTSAERERDTPLVVEEFNPLEEPERETPAVAEVDADRERELEALRVAEEFDALLTEAEGYLDAGRFGQARDAAARARALGIQPGRVAAFEERVTAADVIADGVVAGDDIAPTRSPGEPDGVALDAPDAIEPLNTELLERSALLAFYGGDYAGARAGLDRLLSQTPSARAYLFRASSQVAAGLVGTEDRAVWLPAAAEDYQRAVGGGADPEAYREFISPRIL